MRPTADPTTPPDGVASHAPADAVQRAIVDDMLRAALPLVTALYSAIFVITVLTPSFRAEPLRIVPHAMGALLLGLTWVLRRRSPARAVDAQATAEARSAAAKLERVKASSLELLEVSEVTWQRRSRPWTHAFAKDAPTPMMREEDRACVRWP